jgi:hypothetical protein
MSILDAIAKPSFVDVRGKFEEGRKIGQQNLTKDLAGEILNETLGSKLGMQAYTDLQKVNPDAAIKLKQAIQTDSDSAAQYFLGVTKAGVSILDGGGTPEDVSAYYVAQAPLVAEDGYPGLAQKMVAAAKALKDPSQQAETLKNMRATYEGLGGGGAKKPERVKSSEVINGFVIEDVGDGTFRRTQVSSQGSEPTEEQVLRRQEIQLRIDDRLAAAEAKKTAAINAAEEKDSKTVASVFEAQTAIENLDYLLKDDAYKAIYGTGDNFLPTFFGESITLESMRDQVVDLLGLESRQKLKGQGTISDSESKALARSATILGNPGITEDAALKEINRVRDTFARARARGLKNPEALAQLRSSLSPKSKFLGFEE